MQQIRQMPHRPAQQGFTAGGQGLGIAKDKGGQAVLRTAGAACVITADTADLRPFGAQGQRQGTAQLAAAAKDEDRTMERQSHGRIVKKKRPGRKGPAAHGLRQAMDFALFVRAHDADMAWDAFWEEAQTLGLAPFASALLELSARHFSLPRGAWSRGARADAAAEGLLDDLLDAGVFGHRTEERKRSAAVVYRSFEAENGDSGRVRRALFPSAATLKAPYLYARAHPWLLPVAWVHRWGRYVLRILRGRTSRTEAAESLRVADERLRLLSRLGLRDKR